LYINKKIGDAYMSEEKGIAQKIISKGFFAKQIPGEFNSGLLGERMSLLNLSKSELSKKGYNKWCKLIDFSIPKTDNFRRNLAVPHPLHFILLAQLLEDNWDTLNEHFSKSLYSLTTPEVSEEKIEPKFKMSERINKRIHYLAYNKFILQADIVRYYPSIYTHSIPWALHTKEVAKTAMKDDELIGNTIDKLIRNMQDGQTIGIPIGPATSSIVQEIIGTAIDDEFKSEYGKELLGFRYTDDMEYYFNSREEAERALTILSKILKRYELDLNVSKTKIKALPQAIEPEWIYFLKKFRFRRNKKNKKAAISRQKTDIKHLFSSVFNFKLETGDKGIINYTIKMLRNEVIYKENWSLFESLLLQSIQVEPSIMPTAFETIESYKYRGYPLDYERLEEFINLLIRDNVDVNNDFEVVWALSFAMRLNIKITQETSWMLLKNDNAIINIFTMMLDSKGLLTGELDFTYYESLLTSESLYDSSWLFYYESCMQGWLGKDKNCPLLKEDKFFSQLVNQDITFINISYSKVFKEVKKSIVSLCLQHSKVDMKDLKAEEVIQKVVDIYSFTLESNLYDEIKERLKIDININGNQSENETQPKETENDGTQSKVGDDGTEQKKTDEWLSKFFTTNLKKTNRIKGIIYDEDY